MGDAGAKTVRLYNYFKGKKKLESIVRMEKPTHWLIIEGERNIKINPHPAAHPSTHPQDGVRRRGGYNVQERISKQVKVNRMNRNEAGDACYTGRD